MEPIITLYEREPAPRETLPGVLADAYGGGLRLPVDNKSERPYVIANFVETLDGIVSYNAPGQTGGGVISGDKEQDKMVMGLLRARADAVIVGTSSLRQDANHPRIPDYIYPALSAEYTALRKQLGMREELPISVIVTASGRVDSSDRTFHTPGLKTVIATTEEGKKRLESAGIPDGASVHVVADKDGVVAPIAVLSLLKQEYGMGVALYEGGPTLFASFLEAGVIDELFLTVSPQLAGRASEHYRLGLVEGRAFAPEEAPWATVESVKLAGDHLLMRYAFRQR